MNNEVSLSGAWVEKRVKGCLWVQGESWSGIQVGGERLRLLWMELRKPFGDGWRKNEQDVGTIWVLRNPTFTQEK